MKIVKFIGLMICGSMGAVSMSTQAAGLLTPKNSGLPDLKITEHHVNVVVEDGYAVTQVEQTFSNPHQQDLEAVYSFPVPEKAAVGEFTYWIDGLPIHGEVFEKKEARTIYEEEKQAGRETAITEKDDYKTFDISVYPVKAQQDVKIRLVYIQPAFTDTGIGRYVYPLEEGGVDQQKESFWSRKEVVEGHFSFNFTVRSSYPIDGVRLPHHNHAQVTQLSNDEWQVRMANSAQLNQMSSQSKSDADAINSSENTELNSLPTSTVESLHAEEKTAEVSLTKLDKDIVAYWRYQPNLPGALDLVTYKPEMNGKGTFMMTLYPGDDLGTINRGRDWVFVLDVSGSMNGKYASLVEGVRQGLVKLDSNDRFRVVLFNNSASDISSGFQAVSQQSIDQVIERLEKTRPDGGTNLYQGLEVGMNHLNNDRSTAVILVTDGVANVGVTEKKAFLKLMEKVDIRLFTFIMGNSANRPLLEGMTKISQGFADSVSNSDDIMGKIMLATSKLTHESLRDIEVKIDGVKITGMTPETIGSLYRGQQLIVMGHYWKGGKAQLTIEGKVGAEKRVYQTEIEFPEQSHLHPELERLWAYASIENLQDKMDFLGSDSDSEQAIVDIAKEYGLVTDFTSMVVMREEQFAQRGIDRSNQRRIENEQQMREQRQVQPVRNNRADEKRPIYKKSRPSFGGGGSMGWLLILLIPLVLFKRR